MTANLRVWVLCAVTHSRLSDRSRLLLPPERETNVDRDHRVLGIRCCDSKCRVAFQQTRQRHGEMQFSMADDDEVILSQKHLSRRPIIYTIAIHFLYESWRERLTTILPLSDIWWHFRNFFFMPLGYRMNLFISLLKFLRSLLIKNAKFYIDFCHVNLIPKPTRAISCNIVINANTYFDCIFDQPLYFMI